MDSSNNMSHSGPKNSPKDSLEISSEEAMQQLILANPEQRLRLMGNVTQARHLFDFIQELWGNGQVSADDAFEALKSYPDIDSILSGSQSLKQIVFTVSQNEPGLFDCSHPDITHEHYHENINILNKVLEVYLFLDKYVNESDEHAEVFGHIKLNILDKNINLFRHYARFGSRHSFDAEYREVHLSIFSQLEHIDSACEVFEECSHIFAQALADEDALNGSKNKVLQPFLWSIYLGAINSYYANIILAYHLKDKILLEDSLDKFNDITVFVGKNITKICQYSKKGISGCIQEIIEYKTHIKTLSTHDMTPTELEQEIRSMYDYLGGMVLTNGINDNIISALIDKPMLEDIMVEIKMLASYVECEIVPDSLTKIFTNHIQMVRSIYYQEPSLHELLAMNTLMRTWTKLLMAKMPQAQTKYLELTYESIYLINRSLQSKLPAHISHALLESVTNNIEELETVLKLKDLSVDSLAQWINGSDVNKEDKKQKRSKKKKKHGKKKSQSKNKSSSSQAVNSDLDKKEAGQSKSLCRVFDSMQLDASVETDENARPPRKKEKKNPSNSFNEVVSKKPDALLVMPAPVFLVKQHNLPDEDIPLNFKPGVVVAHIEEEKYSTAGLLNFKMPEDVLEIMIRLENSGSSSYIYGGYVRDDLHKKPYNDIDLVADCDEMTFLILFPTARKEKMLLHKTVYHIDQTISVTLCPDLDLEVFCRERYLAANALVANRKGEVLDPLGIMALAMADKLTPMPGQNIIAAYKADPSRMFRTIRYATHLQKFWDKDIHQALMVCGRMINRMPFGQFLCHFGELFLRGSGETHLYLFLNLGMFPNVSLPLGADWGKYISEKSMSFHFMKHELAQIDRYPVKSRTTQNRLYLLTLFLLPALEKMRFINNGIENTYNISDLETSIDQVLEQFFLLYEGDIKEDRKKSYHSQMKALILQVVWPKFLHYRDYFIQQNYYLSVMQAPPKYFYEAVVDNHRHLVAASSSSINSTPMYQSYLNGGTTYYNASQQEASVSKKAYRV